MAQYDDYTHVDPNDPVVLSWLPTYQQVNITNIGRKSYGIDVRKSIQRALIYNYVQLNQFTGQISTAMDQFNRFENQLTEVISGATRDDEVKVARVDTDGQVYDTIGKRMDAIELDKVGMGESVGTEDVRGTVLVISGLNQTGLGYDVQYTSESDEMTIGNDTIDARDIVFEPAKGGD